MMTSEMTDQHKEEALSRAFVQAIAARAGAIVSTRDYDYSIDGSFHEIAVVGGRRIETGVPINYQLKASKNCTVDATDVIYDLDADAYNRLVFIRNTSTVPCILLLLYLPSDPVQWLRSVRITSSYVSAATGCFGKKQYQHRIADPKEYVYQEANALLQMRSIRYFNNSDEDSSHGENNSGGSVPGGD